MGLFLTLDLHSIYLFIFSIGLGLGIGTVIIKNVFYWAVKNGKLTCDELRIIRILQRVGLAAILIYGLGGIGLFSLDYEVILGLGIFRASMTIVVLLIVNEILISFYFLSRMTKGGNNGFVLDAIILGSGVVSAVSWFFLLLHHIFYQTYIGYFTFLTLYTSVLAILVLITWFVRKNSMTSRDLGVIKRFFLITLLFTGILVILSYVTTNYTIGLGSLKKKEIVNVVLNTYTADDVALHNNSEDCWLIIDKKVFNATEASRLHPAMFNCGQDVSENYHKNHGATIRDKMMKFHIGELGEGKGVQNVDIPFEKHTTLSPYRELYVEENSWNPRELMIVVEKNEENLLVIDGTTHKLVGRVHNVGYQPHTSVFSSDASNMYIISRDGWLTKINLKTLEPTQSVNVGENSRGTAITDNDKYVAVGNYSPGNLVILNAESMEILKTIPLTANVDGKDVESRAGAVVEDGNRIIVALKDANSVWAIDTNKPDFPVTNKFDGIGKNIPALHDAFLTPNGKHYIVASQGSKTAWVLDLATMKPVAEIETGETPHTGPGATWENYIYVPALGEGLITVIDTKTWKPAKYIKTGGPGLFVRSYSKDPSYPYVWADTAFGEHKDEIYVIDARINEIVKTIIPVKGESSWHPEFTYNGDFVYVVSQSANEVEVYDAHTFELVERIKSDTPSAISNVGLRIEEPGL